MIFHNLREIPIPPEGRINHDAKRQVSIYFNIDGDRRRRVIGQATSEYTMHPSDNFKRLFPALWQKYYGQQDDVKPAELKAGLYAVTLAIGERTGVYEIVQKAFGPEDGNGIMDYNMYSIRYRSSSVQLMEDDMYEQLLFSRKRWFDDKYSKFFNDKNDTKINNFRKLWLERCINHGMTNVWLCVDGSNNDCAVKDSDMAELGHAKSLRDTEIVGYMWAVNAEDGRPVTWFPSPGGVPDCKAVKDVIRFLQKSNLTVKGLIMDRGFATQEIFDLAEECGMEAIVMLKANANASTELMTRFAEKIRWAMDCIVDPAPVFGIVDSVKIFSQSKTLSPVGLFFSAMSQTFRSTDLIRKVMKTQKDIRLQIQKDPEHVTLPSDMKKFLHLEKNESGVCIDVTINNEFCQKEIDKKGYYAIASVGKTKRSAKEIHDLYALRDVSEKQFSKLKSQLNGAVTRSHCDRGVRTRLAVSFIASIIRTEIELACKALDLDTNDLIRKLDDISFIDVVGDVYIPTDKVRKKPTMFLANFGITKNHINKICEEVNSTNPLKSLTRKMPVITEDPTESETETKTEMAAETKTATEAKTAEAGAEVKVTKRRGRKFGSKNKKTLEREAREQALRAAGLLEEKEPRGPGRPAGSKNKKTLERERLEAEARANGIAPEAATAEKKGPGRPAGSKNKKTLERERLEAEARAKGIAPEAATAEKKGPGRPAGSKNKKTLERERLEAEARAKGIAPEAATAEKKGPGRPAGSKNKKTLAREAAHAVHQARIEKNNRNKMAAISEGKITNTNSLDTPTKKR